MKQFAITALAIAGSSASISDKRQLFEASEPTQEDQFNAQIQSVCLPRNSSDMLDFNAPCNALRAIQAQCMIGSDGLKYLNPQHADEYDDPDQLPVETQRACICQSQHTDMMIGCFACFKEHGSTNVEFVTTPDKIHSFMEDYCDADKPARDYANAIIELAPEDEDDTSSTTSSDSSAATTFTDPIGNTTDVSLYYTPSVTGTAAYIPAVPTPEGSVANATYTSMSTSDGQIVPTAGASGNDGSAGSEETSGGSTTESDSGAVQTAMAQAGAMGAMGIAALMAAL